MAKETILENGAATLWYYPEDKIIHHKFHKWIHDEDFRNVLNKGCEIFKKKGANKWLSDDRGNSALKQEDTKWAQEDWFPRVFAAGWKFWAIVMPDKAVGRMNMQNIINAYAEQGLTVEIFDDDTKALEWLKSH